MHFLILWMKTHKEWKHIYKIYFTNISRREVLIARKTEENWEMKMAVLAKISRQLNTAGKQNTAR